MPLWRARLALAMVSALSAAAYWKFTGVNPLPPPLGEVYGLLEAVEGPMDALHRLAVASFLAAGVLSLLSPAGVLGASLLAGVYAALRGGLEPAGLALSAVTGAFTLAVAFDGGSVAAAARGLVVRRRRRARREQERPPAPAGLSYFPVGPLRIPRVIDGYEIIEYIGRGGYTVIYKVRKEGKVYVMKVPLDAARFKQQLKEHEISVALREYRLERSKLADAIGECGGHADPEEAARELEAYRANIIGVHAVNERALRNLGSPGGEKLHPDDPPYIIVDYAEEGDAKGAAELVASRPEALMEIAGAVAFFHLATGMVHRDVKPENILVARGGRVMLSDFGIAVRAGERPEGWHQGTPTYMPPEALFYPRFPALPSYDVYSTAVTLYRLLAGEHPVRQYYFIAVSRHPRIGEALRREALRVIRMFEISNLGTTGAVLPKVRDAVYPPLVKEGDEWRWDALAGLSELLTATSMGATILSYEKEVLARALSNRGLPPELAGVIMKALDPDPRRRHPTPLCLWLELRRALTAARG